MVKSAATEIKDDQLTAAVQVKVVGPWYRPKGAQVKLGGDEGEIAPCIKLFCQPLMNHYTLFRPQFISP